MNFRHAGPPLWSCETILPREPAHTSVISNPDLFAAIGRANALAGYAHKRRRAHPWRRLGLRKTRAPRDSRLRLAKTSPTTVQWESSHYRRIRTWAPGWPAPVAVRPPSPE